jgi:hypothetical protein
VNREDLDKYLGKRVRVTAEQEGVLKRSAFMPGSYRLTSDDRRLTVLLPDEIHSLSPSAPDYWPPMPGDVLHYKRDKDLLYIVGMDDKFMFSNSSGYRFALTEFKSGGSRLYDPSSWELVSKGPARLRKEKEDSQ